MKTSSDVRHNEIWVSGNCRAMRSRLSLLSSDARAKSFPDIIVSHFQNWLNSGFQNNESIVR